MILMHVFPFLQCHYNNSLDSQLPTKVAKFITQSASAARVSAHLEKFLANYSQIGQIVPNNWKKFFPIDIHNHEYE